MGRYDRVFNDSQLNDNQAKTEPENKNTQQNVLDSPKIDYFINPEAKDDRGILLRRLDPRPDLEADHELWTLILNNALLLHGLPENLYGTLHFLRASGAGLERVDNDLGFKLVQGQWDAAATGMEWQGVRNKYLDPIREELIKLFKFTKIHGKLPNPAELFKENRAEGKREERAKQMPVEQKTIQDSLFS